MKCSHVVKVLHVLYIPEGGASKHRLVFHLQ